ncbi:MAG: hypothetical protein HOF70_07840, partial [Rhodospirillaceae bacterium]|nr:hypothetical protein [Rhodospirillaceae bacterium]MBT4672011.1 hypothetical protein [Rhodospirillaceae bacterium]MBT6290060.1 hypothetical protein [Rhodospirillaceae bacterium]
MPDAQNFKPIADASRVTSLERLKELYGEPNPNSLLVEMPVLDEITREFIGLSPMVMIGTVGDV